ncbi:hypothetical protein BVRB_033000 [Beta vulgaris subsp. vulgaris]|uniref:Uncharacterized protein n=1 Tax=Beta vulgaris subsp. vulgaris TaxID=3555 RepID=A0A0J8B044_BETVV|nr:hypothetical protein BVRB_033000 [Beta vulgaris subsp. vulgaris]
MMRTLLVTLITSQPRPGRDRGRRPLQHSSHQHLAVEP